MDRGGDASDGSALPVVSRTALAMAFIRDVEQARPDRLFDDPYAGDFLSAAGDVFAEPAGAREPDPEVLATVFEIVSAVGALRTRFFDDHLASAVAAGCRQVVILAAGLDARAHRLAWPAGTTVYELDLPEVLEFKERVLAGAPGSVRRVPVDLREDWSPTLVGAGFVDEEPTAWLAEGLLPYLEQMEAARLLTTVTELSAVGSGIALDDGPIADPGGRALMQRLPGIDEFASLWHDGGPDVGAWLDANGWTVDEVTLSDLADRYDRPLPPHATGTFTTGDRRSGPSG